MANVKATDKIKSLGSELVSGTDRIGGAKPAAKPSKAGVVVTIPFFGGEQSEQRAWDTLHIVIPGIADVLFENTKITFGGNGPSVKWDVKPAPGTDGASETDQGYQPAQITLDILLYSETLFTAFAQLLSVAKVKPGKTRSIPIQIFHPHLELFGLRNFVIMGTPLLKDSGAQMKTATLHILEYFEKPKKRAAVEKTGLAGLQTIFDQPQKNAGKAASTANKPRNKDSGP